MQEGKKLNVLFPPYRCPPLSEYDNWASEHRDAPLSDGYFHIVTYGDGKDHDGNTIY